MITSRIYSVIILIAILITSFHCIEAQSVVQEMGVIKTYELIGDSTAPEGISVDSRNGYIYTGSLQDGSMQVTIDGKSAYLVEPGSEILLTNVLGSSIDEKNDRIWICSNDFSMTFKGTPKARVSVLHLSDGTLIKQFDETDLMSMQGVYPFVNDVILDLSGNAYISNSASNTIFKVSADLKTVQVLAHKFPEPPAGKKYSLNGIEISPDQHFLFSNSFVMTEQDAAALFRINISSGEVALIDYEEQGTTDFSRFGGDGLLMLNKNTLLCMSVAGTLLKIDLNKEFTNATITNISSSTEAQKEMVGAATIAEYKNKIYTTNAQGLSLFNTDFVVQKPYKVIEMPKSIFGL